MSSLQDDERQFDLQLMHDTFNTRPARLKSRC